MPDKNQPLLDLVRPWVTVLLLLLTQARAATGEEPRLYFVPVPPDESGLAHEINSEPKKYGEIKYPWMSPPVDITGNGHLDLMYYGHHGGGAAVWLNRGDGTFRFDERGYGKRWVFGLRDPVWIDLNGNGAMDGIITELSRQIGQICLNDGSGQWELTGRYIPSKSAGNHWEYMFIDTNGDGRFDGLWAAGRLLQMDPPLSQWKGEIPEEVAFTEVWNANEALDRPEALQTERGGWRDAYSVDLTGDGRNELIVQMRGGGGFTTSLLATFVLTRTTTPDGDETWTDTTAQRGLPTEVGHCLYPEDVDVDGHMDLVDLETGHWYKNDGSGNFTNSPHRIYDPDTRDRGRYRSQKGRPWTPDNETYFLDLTNNGYRDLATSSDHGQEQGVFLNLGNGRFVEVDGFGNRRHRKFGDLTGNHKLDMVRNVPPARVTLFRNETPHRGIHVRLAPNSPAEASLGSKVWVYQAGHLGDKARLVHYRQGFQAQRSGRSNVIGTDLHVGLGDRESVDVRVRFPSGVVREVRGARADTRVVVHEEP